MGSEGNQRAAFRALALARREGVSFDDAARRLGRSRDDLAAWVGPALRRKGASLYPTAQDDLTRAMLAPTARGVVDADIEGSRRAEVLARYWRAAWHRRDTGESSLLPDTPIPIAPGVVLPADPEVIDELAWQKDLDIDDIYDIS